MSAYLKLRGKGPERRNNSTEFLARKKFKKRKPRIGEGPAGAKRKSKELIPLKKMRAKSAKELYDSKRKSFRDTKKIESFKLGKAVRAVKKSILRDDYKPKIKNEKEIYSSSLEFSKQDYADVIKNYQKTQKRKKRNRAVVAVGTAAAAAAIQSKKDKENKK